MVYFLCVLLWLIQIQYINKFYNSRNHINFLQSSRLVFIYVSGPLSKLKTHELTLYNKFIILLSSTYLFVSSKIGLLLPFRPIANWFPLLFMARHLTPLPSLINTSIISVIDQLKIFIILFGGS